LEKDFMAAKNNQSGQYDTTSGAKTGNISFLAAWYSI
jgi:hypothetical protein